MATLLRPLVEKAVVEAVGQYDSIVNIKGEMSSLKRIVSLIEGALPEAEEKQADNPGIREWLRELDNICYDARDILDEFITVAASIRAKRTSKRVKFNSLHFLRGSHCFSTVILLRFRLAKKIKSLRKRLDSMMKDMETAKLLDFVGAGCSLNATKKNRPETGPSPDMHLFVGRGVEKGEIMEKLLNPKENHVEVVPIWGMGGVGKTTLAQSVYNDDRVIEEQYPRKNRRWLCVGEKEFSAKEIISKIIDESGTNDVELYQRKLIEKFNGDRFLIVLDDVWEICMNEWKLFQNPLNRIGKGGLIITTTRKTEVITKIGIQVPDHLRTLSNEDCWQIFESHAFTDGCTDLDLKKGIGKQIVEKLKGLPLAAEVVGRALSNEPDVQIWTNFLEAREWNLRTSNDDVMPALRWSYNRLPSHLKQCFAYCSLFPKDHIFDEETLVKMWMAHGLIENAKGGETRRPEDIGVSYFKQLVYASLFQYVEDKYVMHDMIHDLAVLVSNEEFLRTNSLLLNVGQLEKVRHICIHPTYFWENLNLCKSKRSTMKRLLTLYTLFDWKLYDISKSSISHITPSLCKNVIRDTFKQFKSIRVLVLVSDEIIYIPKCISELIHLRYLDIKKTNVSRIPDTLCDLHNLQTLIAPAGGNYTGIVTVLPENIVNMVNLRHLRACLPTCKGVKNLTSLQELYSISISKGDKISELGDMRQLHGRLTIKYLENVTSEEDAAHAIMQEKAYIDHLKLEFTKGLGDSTDVQTKVLDALQCPPNLTYLRIHGYNGLTSPSWMTDGKLITNLQGLHLKDWHRLEYLLAPLGQLSCLKYLKFYKMVAIKKLGEEFYGKQIKEKVFFPSLEKLELKCMKNLKEWDDLVIEDTSVMFFPCLKQLHIFNCLNLVSVLPHVNIKDPSKNVANVMRSLYELCIETCDGLVVLELDILVSLKHLNIWNCSNLTRITSAVNVAATVETLSIEYCGKLEKMEFGSLSSLKTLTVSCCNELISFSRLVSIEELDVYECEKLRTLSISDPGLNSLQSLEVVKCPMLEISFEDASTSSSSSALPLSRLQFLKTDNILVFSKLLEHDLVSLEEMYIGRFPKIEMFNKIVKNDWQKLTLLETLVICRCDDLKSLPPDIHELSSLKKLWLHHCPKLQALPADGLPLSLEALVITECPLLYERCQIFDWDWDKIKHVPEREILQTFTRDRLYELAWILHFGQSLDLMDMLR